MEAIAQRGETVLIADGNDGYVVNLRTGERYPGPLPVQGVLSRGYWLPFDGDPKEALALVAAGTFTETKHRRWPTGTKVRGKEGGGRFAPKATTAQPTGKEEEEPTEAQDSQQAHTDENGRYTEERQDLHAGIKTWFLDTAEHNGAKPEEHPEALFMAGGSGSGKSTVLEQMDDAPEGYVSLNPDLVKEMLPEYEEMKAAGDPNAAAFVHEESSDITKDLTKETIARRYNMVVDGTGDSGEGKFLGKIQAAEKAGYSTRVVVVDIPTEEALKRAQARARRTGRMVPEHFLRAVHSSVSARHLEWRDQVNNWEVWANDQSPPKLIARRTDGGQVEYLDRARYDQFVEKANEPGADTGA